MNEDLAKDLKAEMIPEGFFRNIAEAIGTENLVKVADIIGGATFYWPKLESFVRPVRDARIKDEFNGYNHIELARKYDVTERWVRQLCGEGHAEGQLNLFENDPGAQHFAVALLRSNSQKCYMQRLPIISVTLRL